MYCWMTVVITSYSFTLVGIEFMSHATLAVAGFSQENFLNAVSTGVLAM